MRNRTTVLASVMAAALMLVTACGGDSDQPDDASDVIQEMEDELGIDMDDLEGDGGSGDDEGDLEDFGDIAGDEIPEGFPDAVAVPDDYTVNMAIGNPEDGFTVNIHTQEDPEQLADRYESGFADAGWSVEVAFTSAEVTGLEDLYTVDAANGDEAATVTIQMKEEGHTAIMIYTTGPHS